MIKLFSQKSDIFQGVALAVLVYLALSIGDAFLKRVTFEHELVYTGLMINLAVMFCLLIVALFTKNIRGLYHTHSLKLHTIRALVCLGVYLTFMYAISNLPIATTYTLCLIQPFILVLLAHLLLKEYIGIHRIIAIICGFIGVLIVLRPGFIALDLAAISALICAFLFACQNILVKFIDQRDHWMSYVFYVQFIQLPFLGGYLYMTGGFDVPAPGFEIWGWIFISGAAYMIGLGAIPLALHKIDAAIYGGLEFSILIWGTILGYFMFAEVPDIWTIAGAGVIVASGIYLVYREHKAHQAIKELER